VPDIVEVANSVEEVSCNGGKTFGHPRIYMNFGDEDVLECYYCGRRFVRKRPEAGTSRNDAA